MGEALNINARAGVSEERQLADVALDPLLGGAFIASSFGKGLCGDTDLTSLYSSLQDRAVAIRNNDLGGVEDMLTAQATALNSIFLELARRSAANMGEYIQATETYMRLALKAQAQCRATLETLATIKNPPLIYARQANIAAGPQQVNNGRAASCAGEIASLPNELLETDHGERLEPRKTGTSISGNPALEAVGAIDGSADRGRQGPRQSQRRQGRKAADTQG